MAIIGTLPNILQNGTIADASQVMADFNFIVNQTNSNAASISQIISGGQLLNIQSFATPGSFTYTPTTGTFRAIIDIVSGGGAGGGAVATAGGQVSSGSGGGGGAYVRTFIASVTSQSITVGAGGLGASGANGNPGGSTLFGGVITAFGGSGGLVTGAGANVQINGGAGGLVSIGGTVINSTGRAGGPTWASTSQGMTGDGGSSLLGWGAISQTTSGVPGIAATGFGGGGSGAFNGASAAAKVGGNGAGGLIIVYEFI